MFGIIGFANRKGVKRFQGDALKMLNAGSKLNPLNRTITKKPIFPEKPR